MFVKSVAEHLHGVIKEHDGDMPDGSFHVVWDYEDIDARKPRVENARQVEKVAQDRGYYTRLDVDLLNKRITLWCKY